MNVQSDIIDTFKYISLHNETGLVIVARCSIVAGTSVNGSGDGSSVGSSVN